MADGNLYAPTETEPQPTSPEDLLGPEENMAMPATSPPIRSGDLATRHGFTVGYDLDTELERARSIYVRDRTLRLSTPRLRQKAVATVAKKARDLLDALRELDRAGGGFLLNDEDHSREWLANLERLRERARAQSDKMADAPETRGRSPNLPKRFLVIRLYNTYRCGTGSAPRYTWDAIESRYKGPFVDFALDAAKAIGVWLSGDCIVGAIKSMDE